MKRSPLQGRRKTAAQSLAVVSSIAICGWAQAASPTHTVFAAENALYGSGYDIGTADGWIDTKLRTAIRQYQSDRPELSARLVYEEQADWGDQEAPESRQPTRPAGCSNSFAGSAAGAAESM